MTIPILSLHEISKTFGQTAALRLLSVDVSNGEFLTLVGPSGSGKSTLLSIIAGFMSPDGGRIRLKAADITDSPPERRCFGVVPQGYALFPHMTVSENVAFPLRVRKSHEADLGRRVTEMLELTRIGTLRDRYPRELSGGEQQRVALARALAFEPDILLLDEPMSALDAALRHDLHQELVRLHRHVGKTFIHVTHDQQEALALSDRVAVLRAGRIEQIGSPRGLYMQPRTEFVARFLGKNNILAGSIEARGEGLAFRWKGHLLPLPQAVASIVHPSGAATLSIRPGHIRLSPADGGETFEPGAWTGTVVRQTFHGASVDTLVAVDDEVLTAEGDAHGQALTPGQLVTLSFDPAGLWFLPPATGAHRTAPLSPERAREAA